MDQNRRLYFAGEAAFAKVRAMALKGFDLDGTRILAVDDPEIVAAMKAINYIWDAVPDSPHKTAIVVKSLDDLFRELAPLATDPPLMTLPLGR